MYRQPKLLSFVTLVAVSWGLLAGMSLLAQAAPEPPADNTLASRQIITHPLPEAFSGDRVPAADGISAMALTVCGAYHFHNQTVNVGSDGVQKIANTTAPTGATQTVQRSISWLSGQVEIARFYTTPVLTHEVKVTGDIVGSIWLQTTNFNATNFTAEMWDYNPGTGETNLLDDIDFQIISDGINEVELILTTPGGTTIPAGHRILFVLSGSTDLLQSATITLYYDSASRDSKFTICYPPPPKLVITKSGPLTALAQEPITYTLTITNTGGLTATNLTISDTLPTGATYVSGGTPAGNVVSWVAGSLGPGAKIQRSFVVTATATISNSDYGVAADGNISTSGQQVVVTSVSPAGQPNLVITKAGPAEVSSGEEITYELTVINGGDTDATGLVVTDTIPAGAAYVSGGTRNSNVVSWPIDTLAANGDQAIVSFVVTATDTITNDDYGVTASGNISALGQEAVTTVIAAGRVQVPVILKGGTTRLIVQTSNTGSSSLIRVVNPGSGTTMLQCSVGNNVTTTCGDFPAIGTYRIVANTQCGVLQGTFNDAAPGATVTRTIFCN
jgi:uncharacterized repeat protein (TIGR01451 family)